MDDEIERLPGYRESGHWYQRDGTPCYEVPNKTKGGMRRTTLTDARKLDLVPSVTTILGVASKQGLERWKQEQMMLAALTLERRPDEAEKAFLARIWEDAAAQATKAAERGKRCHGAIQNHLTGHGLTEHQFDYLPQAKAVQRKLLGLYGTRNWTTERPFAYTAGGMGYGGRSDLYAMPPDFAPLLPTVIGDVKTKEFTTDDITIKPIKALAFDEHAMQLAAYAKGYGWDTSNVRCMSVFVSVTEDGLVVVKEWTVEEIQRAWRMFLALLRYYYLLNNLPIKET
jgi:hypothetical protein